MQTLYEKEIGPRIDQTKASQKNKERGGEKHPRWNPNKSELTKYARRVRRLSELTYRANKHILNPNDLPRTLCGTEGGYQLDHIKSIRYGFENQIPIEEMAAISNLQLLSWEDNRTKWA